MKFLSSFLLSLFLMPCLANEVNITLSQHSIDNQVHLSVTNNGAKNLALSKIKLQLNQQHYEIRKLSSLAKGETKKFSIQVSYPQLPGSYVQVITLYYFHQGHELSLSDVGYYHYQQTQLLKEPVNLTSESLEHHHFVILSGIKNDRWKLILPNEVRVKELSDLKEKLNTDTLKLDLYPKHSELNLNYPIFAVQEMSQDGKHYAQILKSRINTSHQSKSSLAYKRGETSSKTLLVISLISLIVFVFFKRKRATVEVPLSDQLLLLFSSRLLFLSLSYYLLKNSHDWLGFSELISSHLSGKNYEYFFAYFIDYYYWSFILLYLPLIYYVELKSYKDEKRDINLIENDKYIAALLSLRHFTRGKIESLNIGLQSPATTGWLLLAVKLFFLPLLLSWLIGNLIHQWNLWQNFSWTFYQINSFLLALLILTDTAIFAFGYLFESKRLNSQIRSVDASVWGWLVCLWCYPPFNNFSFSPFDMALFPIHVPIEEWVKPWVLTLVTLLWGVFVWASLSLGFKASNLTNRGTVDKGPYRYCRHPAYSAKLLIWLIQAIFLGEYFVGLLMAFVVIYALRAYTEERHLSLDPEYRAYQVKVPYRFIPKIY